MKIRSIRKTLTLWYLLIVAILLSSFSLAMYIYFRTNLYNSIDAALLANAETILKLKPVSLPSQEEVLKNSIRKALGISKYPVFTKIVDLSGQVNYQSSLEYKQLPLSDLAKKNGENGFFTYETFYHLDSYPVRVLTTPIYYNGFFTHRFIQVATSKKSVEITLSRIRVFIYIAIPLALLIVSLGGVFLANRALRPVKQMVQTAKHLSVYNLNQEIEVETKDEELMDLADTFNKVFKRLFESFNNISRFSSDVSHELKTPLTIIRGQIELNLRKKRSLDEYVSTLQSNLEEVQNMTNIVEQLSLLSKLEKHPKILNPEKVYIIELLSKIVEGLKPLTEKKNITISCHDPVTLMINADPLMLERVILNLLENAIKYSVEKDTIRVETFLHGNNKGIRVIDHGPGIVKEDIPHIFTRFYRADKSRSKDTGGSGLGLNIVQSIVEYHGGNINVESVPFKRTCFQINFPYKSTES